jgi:hypothetical protein
VPPWISFDPPLVRERYSKDATCSIKFDPVGADAVNDRDLIVSPDASRLDRYRMVIWERGINKDGSTTTSLSGVNNETVKVYVQADIDTPLIIDTDGDTVCDDIDRHPSTGADPLPVGPFAPITPTATAPKETDVTTLGTASKDLLDVCTETAANADSCSALSCRVSDKPGTTPILCSGESVSMTRVVGQKLIGSTALSPVIYGLSPATGTTAAYCTGRQLESNGDTGWRCMVAAAKDNAGNLGISQPLRVCYALNGDSDCIGPAPTCTDGCTMPSEFVDLGMPRVLRPN